jgi:ATP synthase protein I
MGSIKKEFAELFRSLSVATTIAMSMVFSVFAGVLTGYYVDTWLFEGRTSPWFTLICLFFGVAGGFKNFLLLSKRFREDEKPGRGTDEANKESHGRNEKHTERKSG